MSCGEAVPAEVPCFFARSRSCTTLFFDQPLPNTTAQAFVSDYLIQIVSSRRSASHVTPGSAAVNPLSAAMNGFTEDDQDFVAVKNKSKNSSNTTQHRRQHGRRQNKKGKGRYEPPPEKALNVLLQQKIDLLRGSSFLQASLGETSFQFAETRQETAVLTDERLSRDLYRPATEEFKLFKTRRMQEVLMFRIRFSKA